MKICAVISVFFALPATVAVRNNRFIYNWAPIDPHPTHLTLYTWFIPTLLPQENADEWFCKILDYIQLFLDLLQTLKKFWLSTI